MKGLEHFSPVSSRPVLAAISDSKVPDYILFKRLASVLFPYRLSKYPGVHRGMALLLGITPRSYVAMCKPSGNAVFRLPQIRRAEKIVSDLIIELTAILDGLRKRREHLELTQAPKRRGMFDVRVRDETGIPRNAIRWRGKKNLPPF